jgi:hypothetical protein
MALLAFAGRQDIMDGRFRIGGIDGHPARFEPAADHGLWTIRAKLKIHGVAIL